MKGKKSNKVYTMQVQLTLSEKPEGRYYFVNTKCKGKILKIKTLKGKWLVDVEFKASSMIELMVMCDERIVSTELQ